MVPGGFDVTSSTTRLTPSHLVGDAVRDLRQHVVRQAGPVGGHRVFATTPGAARSGGRRCGRRPARRPSARRRAARPGTARSRGRGRPRSALRARSRRPCAAGRDGPAVTSPTMRMPRPGPGNGWRPTMTSGRPSSRPIARTSSLNRVRSGSTSSNCRSSGRPPTLWWLLMFAVPVPPPDSTTSGYSVPCTRKRIGSPSWPRPRR